MNQTPGKVPQITPEFLNSILRSVPGIDQAVVTDVHQEQVTGHNRFNANLLRLVLIYDQPAAAAPQSLIAKLPTVNTELHERATVFQPGARESWFRNSMMQPGRNF
jgi:hypothetical protein